MIYTDTASEPTAKASALVCVLDLLYSTLLDAASQSHRVTVLKVIRGLVLSLKLYRRP